MSRKTHFHQPIGIFDSGIGGLTVASAISKHLPNEEIIYFGDTAHMPYGDKSGDAIRYYCLRIVKFLLEQDCKMIVVACNSAASAAYRTLLDFFTEQALFVNVVDPLVLTVAKHPFEHVGVIATKATTQTGIYPQKLKEQNKSLQVSALATPLLASMIEEGYIHNNISHEVLKQYLSNPSFENIEAMLLACTHYPLIKPEIEAFFEGRVRVFDSTDVVATAVYEKLDAHRLLNDKQRNPHRFYVSDFTQAFEDTTRIFYPEGVQLEPMDIWKEGM